MKKILFGLYGTARDFSKTQVGTTIIGAVAGGCVAHLFSQSSREQELEKTKESLRISEYEVTMLKQRVDAASDKREELLKELMNSDQYGNRTRADLMECQFQKGVVEYAYKNSYCFLRQQVPDCCNNQQLVPRADVDKKIVRRAS